MESTTSSAGTPFLSTVDTATKTDQRRDYEGDQVRIRDMNASKRLDVISLLSPLRRYAKSLTRDDTQADDLVQDTLVRAYERQASFRASGNLKGWLLSILHNIFIDERRSRTAVAQRLARVTEVTETAQPADQETRVRLQQIQQAFLSLPEEQRSALHLVAIEGLSYQEAAESLAIPVGTLMSRLGRARAALRAFEAGQGLLKIASDKARPNLRVVGDSHD
jgi:RNA polymerase sigma-70 factor, ECF subfamily